jgi:hypothetical protein
MGKQELRSDLIAARAVIANQDDWCKGAWAEGHRHCSWGAGVAVLMKALGLSLGDVTVHPRFYAVEDALNDATPDGSSIVQFNDRDTTTHGDILALFDRAINAIPEDA